MKGARRDALLLWSEPRAKPIALGLPCQPLPSHSATFAEMARRSRKDRHEATKLAALKWIKDNGGTQSSGARAAEAAGVKIAQPILGAISKGLKIGEKATDDMARLYETTPDGLVAIFLGGKTALPLRDIQGWAKAKAEAMEDPGVKVEGWVWRAIDDVVVPSSLRRAEKQMVIQIAAFVDYWGQVSGIRKARAIAP